MKVPRIYLDTSTIGGCHDKEFRPWSNPEILPITDEALNLADLYLERAILTPKYRDDGIHIALASLANVDVVVSWNFKHIVHYAKIRLFNAVNIEQGIKTIAIYSPREVTNYEEDY